MTCLRDKDNDDRIDILVRSEIRGEDELSCVHSKESTLERQLIGSNG